MAVRGGGPPVIVELKRRYALSLVYQGIERQRIRDAVYLAVAAPTGRKAWAMWNRSGTVWHSAALQLCARIGPDQETSPVANPWTKKHPFMSMWRRQRGRQPCERPRDGGGEQATGCADQAATRFWTSAWLAELSPSDAVASGSTPWHSLREEILT